MANPQVIKIQRVLLTGCVASITVLGAWYGAGLKTNQELKQRQSADDIESQRLAQLLQLKRDLEADRQSLEKRIADLDKKRASANTSISGG
ncbi:MAG: hypothetical protein M1825_002392 [Sarcosagium campestre]|nr:MAG: hypothetical protein M1825_002392 [Sarcosagium campestre]